MFVKTTKSKNYTYLQLVESYREGGKTKHRVIAPLGRLDQLLESGSLKTIGEKLLTLNQTPILRLEDVEETRRLCYGHLVYQVIWNRLNIGELLNKCAKDSKIQFDLEAVIFYTVIHRLLKSQSKRQAYQDWDLFYDLPSISSLQHIYRSLDFLSSKKEAIQTQLFYSRKGVYAKSIDIAFYDVTNYYFESNRSDSLRDFGFSKAGKFNEVQVVMGLFVDRFGRPIGYELFPGNTFDGQTMVAALKLLQQTFKIKKVIIVADKGLNSKQNFHLIKEAGYDYIVSARLKSLPKSLIGQVLDTQDMEIKETDELTGQPQFSWKQLDYPVSYKDEQGNWQKWTDHLLITWSAKRASKDAKDRQRQIEKAKHKLEQGVDLKNKKGAHRFLKMDDAAETKAIALDQDRINQDAKWDGFYGLQFSKADMSPEKVLKNYHQLWKIEESFRVLKTTMKTRPIFHWTPNRIKGHFMICFLAFMLERELELILQKKGIKISPDQLKVELNQMQLSELTVDGQKFLLKSKDTTYTNQILEALSIQKFKNLTPCK